MADSLTKADGKEVQSRRDLDRAFADFLRIDVANGDASPDTVRSYRTQVASWLDWCQSQDINPARATTEDVKAYRQDLVSAHYKPASIAHRLVILRRFYQAAVNAGLRADNPVAGVRAPREKRAVEDFGYLSEVELTLLLRSVPEAYKEKNLRDRAMLALMGLQGLRTIEIERANVSDLQRRGDATALLVHGKGKDRLVFLRPDVLDALNDYLSLRGKVEPDGPGMPLFASVGNYAGGKRISRRGIRKVVDFYLLKAGLKKSGLSNHALRHTAATLGYKHSHDLRAVQDMLGHADPKTTARYARVVDMAKSNPALAVPIKLK